LIDGHTESFLGYTRFIYPHKTACLDCVDLFKFPDFYEMSNVVNNPQYPEQCVAWASAIAWDSETPFISNFETIPLDGDNQEHIQWTLKKALEYADRFHIPKEKITYRFTQGVIKNIKPSITATNAIIAATCVNEAFKAVSEASYTLDNCVYYYGNMGVGTKTLKIIKKEECEVCMIREFNVSIKKELSLSEFIEYLKQDERLTGMGQPVLTRWDKNNRKSYWTQMKAWARRYEHLLNKAMSELVEEGDLILVSSWTLSFPFVVKVFWQQELDFGLK